MTTRRVHPGVGAALALGALLWLSLWIGTPSGWGPFEALGLVLFGDDAGARTLARARALEVVALAVGGAIQVLACVVAGRGRGLVAREAPLLTGASAGAWTLFCGYGAAWAGAGAAAGALAGAWVAASTSGALRRALLAVLPTGFLVHALATAPSQGLVWLDASRALGGDAAGLDGARVAVLAAGALVGAASLLAPGGPARWLAAAAGGVAAAAVGWFAGAGSVVRTLAPGCTPVRAALLGAALVVGAEAGLAALTAPGRLPVAAATFPLALAAAVLARGGSDDD